jgi:hypothetical protein
MTTSNGIEKKPCDSNGRTISPEIASELQRFHNILNTRGMATRVWQKLLNEEQRQQLGGDLSKAYMSKPTIPMWMELQNVSIEQAVVELAFELDFLTYAKYLRLCRELDLSPTGANAFPLDKPVWSPETGELTLNGKTIRRVSVRKTMSKIQMVLDAFQNASWVNPIENPLLGQDQQDLHQVVRRMHEGLTEIRFSSQAGGEEVVWKRLDRQSTPSQPR